MNEPSDQDDLLNALDKNENSYLLDMTTEKMEQIKKKNLTRSQFAKDANKRIFGQVERIYLLGRNE
jgi:hypothetical protein